MATKKQNEGEVKARVLVEGIYGKPNDVFVFANAKEAEAAGPDVDTHPDAVAYAESLR